MPSNISLEKVTVIVPVYNGAETIKKCLDAVMALDYPPGHLELIAVDDGSKDGTTEIIKEGFSRVKILFNEKNRGRSYTRLRGAKEAAHKKLLFIDSRIIVNPSLMTKIFKASEDIQMAYEVISRPGPWSSALAALRRKAYKQSDVLYVDKQHFDGVPKGTGLLFIPRELFIEASQILSYTRKDISEDTGLFAHLVKKGYRIFRNPEISVSYLHRRGIGANLKHLFERGPKFIDYYYRHHKTYTTLIHIGLPVLLVALTVILFRPAAGLFILAASIIFVLALSLILGKSAKERTALLFLLPLIFLTFGCGVLLGLILKWTRGFNGKSKKEKDQKKTSPNTNQGNRT
jgi:glycosyltransferase involved in cell wall biosynthesis